MPAVVEIIGQFTDNISGGLSNIAGVAFEAFQAVVDSASDSEQAIARLDGVLRATGGAAGLSSEQLQEMADSLQGVTRFSDETILAGEALLLTFRNITGETFERTVPAMLDMAEIFGSVDSAAMQLGKALNDPLAGMGALSRAGIQFSEEQRDMIENFMEMGDIASAQNIILSEVEAQVSGLAETMGGTFAGQMEIFNNRLDTVKETIGGALLPILGDFLDVFEQGIPVLQNFADILSRAISTGDFSEVGAVFRNIIDGFQNLDVSAFGEAFTNFTASIDWEQISQNIADGVESIDWGRVGNVISEALGFLAIGIGNIISNIDWPRLLNSFANAFADLIGGLFGFVDWEDMIASAEVGFRYVGQSIVDGLRAGLLAAWTNFTNLPNLLFNNFISSVKAILGISSPSAVFADIGRDIVLGLTGGFLAYWDDLIRIAQNSLDDFLGMFGIDVSFGGAGGGSTGSHNTGGTTTPGTGGTTTGGQTVINIYGASYWGVGGPGDVDCVSPHPLVAASGNQLVTSGF